MPVEERGDVAAPNNGGSARKMDRGDRQCQHDGSGATGRTDFTPHQLVIVAVITDGGHVLLAVNQSSVAGRGVGGGGDPRTTDRATALTTPGLIRVRGVAIR